MENEVFRGYLIKVLQEMGKSKEEIKKAIEETYRAFNDMTEDEAREYYINY